MNPRSKHNVHTLLFIFLFCISILLPVIVFPQINKLDEKNLEETMRNPWKDDRSVFLQDWLILGSIPIQSIDEIDTDFFDDQKGEANLQPKEGEGVKISGSDIKWTAVKCKDIVDLQKAFQGGHAQCQTGIKVETLDKALRFH